MMKKIIVKIFTALAVLGCSGDFEEVVDFTEVENPNLSEASVVGVENSSSILLKGVERELSLALNEILVLAELGSDNYVNTQTFFSQLLDGLEMQATDPDIRDTARDIHRLRELALFGLETVGPADPSYSAETEAEYRFFEGMSYLYFGMYFSAIPQEPFGVLLSDTEHYQNAIDAFDTALVLNPKPEYHLAIARANYYLGNKAESVRAAQAALSLSPDFDRFAQYDESNGPSNTFESALYQRATFDDLQPLPTLDFLDPKYSFLSPEEDAPVHYLKAEEAYLILAEANLSDGNAVAAQANISDLLDLVATREVRNIDDSIEQRSEVDPGGRPDNSSVVVNGREGLVLDRQSGNIDVPSVSGTSLTEDDITSFTADDAGLELLYRTRQEIFIAEGIRFADMGIKLILDENEILLNENVSDGDPGTRPVIPPFIEAVIPQLDAITYDADAGTATTAINLNEILVDNKDSEFVLPFH
jgi:tetratricopeptide (TPR) repeat protein